MDVQRDSHLACGIRRGDHKVRRCLAAKVILRLGDGHLYAVSSCCTGHITRIGAGLIYLIGDCLSPVSGIPGNNRGLGGIPLSPSLQGHRRLDRTLDLE